MTKSDLETHGRSRRNKRALIIAAVVLTSALTTVALLQISKPSRFVDHPGLLATLAVEPFERSDSEVMAWDSSAFADSLVSQLANISGLDAARSSFVRRADFVLQGDVRMHDSRVVVSVRLVENGRDQAPVWRATFWRTEASSAMFARDVAAAVAEGLYTHRVQNRLTVK